MSLTEDNIPPSVEYMVRGVTFICFQCQKPQEDKPQFILSHGEARCQSCIGELLGQEFVREFLATTCGLRLGDIVDGKRYLGFDGLLRPHFVSEDMWKMEFGEALEQASTSA